VEPHERAVERLFEVVDETNAGGEVEVALTGQFTQEHDLQRVSQEDLAKGEFIGMPAAMLVLLLVFGTVVAAALPLLLAIVAIIVGLGLAAVIGVGWEISFFMVNMLTGMGLALGIDYALFIVSRFREESAQGRDTAEAIAAAGATASRAVLFSGSAFVLAMVGLLLV
jgi:RND superfamily putative drug exporter